LVVGLATAGLATGFLAGAVGWGVVLAAWAVDAASDAAGTTASAKATKSDHTDFRTAASSLFVVLGRDRRTYLIVLRPHKLKSRGGACRL
jgi:hypothetical protein